MEKLIEPFAYSFMMRAFIVGLIVSLCSSLLGVVLVLKRYSMIGDGLSHAGFGILAVATALNIAPLYVSLFGVMLCTCFIMLLNERSKFKGDALTALISTGALAVGILVSSFGRGSNIDLNSYLFGSILSTTNSDVALSGLIGGVVLIYFTIFYNKIFSLTFDEQFSKACGMNVTLYNIVTAVLTAVTVVIGMRLMGTLLISAFLVIPPMCAMRVSKHFKTVLIVSTVISVTLMVMGLYVTYYNNIPTGATTVCIGLALFALLTAIAKVIALIYKRKAIKNKKQ